MQQPIYPMYDCDHEKGPPTLKDSQASKLEAILLLPAESPLKTCYCKRICIYFMRELYAASVQVAVQIRSNVIDLKCRRGRQIGSNVNSCSACPGEKNYLGAGGTGPVCRCRMCHPKVAG